MVSGILLLLLQIVLQITAFYFVHKAGYFKGFHKGFDHGWHCFSNFLKEQIKEIKDETQSNPNQRD